MDEKKEDVKKKSTTEQLNEGRVKVDSAISFVDWIRRVIDWLRGLIRI